MNKVIVASYMGSGSSAATDLLAEYENTSCPNGSYEYIFLHCPNGVFDLEDKLLMGNNALRSDEALRSFEQTMQDLYDNDFWWFGGYRNKVSERFMQYVGEFISTITTVSFSSFWYEQEKLTKQQWTANRVKKKLGSRHYDLLATQLRMAYPAPDEFYKAARTFITATLSDVNGGLNGRTILLDQLLLPHNLWRAEKYFDSTDTRIIVVSRDPRDVFAANKYIWSKQGDSIPMPLDVDAFCANYKRMREAERFTDSNMVLRVCFEDLVLNYDETVARIEAFVGQEMLGEHAHARTQLNPDVSKGNIGIFGFSDESLQEARIIERELGDYLYPIDKALVDPGKIGRAF